MIEVTRSPPCRTRVACEKTSKKENQPIGYLSFKRPEVFWRSSQLENSSSNGPNLLEAGRRLKRHTSGMITFQGGTLRRIQSRNPAIKDVSFRELLDAKLDLPVFALSDGTTTDNLRGTFRIFLKQYGLLKDPRTGQNRTLYSLRHTYATFSLTYKRGVDIYLLATQMGTSTLMIERHYSHLIDRMRSATLAGGRW